MTRRVGADLVWEPYGAVEVAERLHAVTAPWWIAGGLALEAFVGASWRGHGDADVGCFRDGQAAVRRHLATWDPWCADPPGTLRPWPVGETLPQSVHDVWVRERPGGPWRFQLVIDERYGDTWVFRRDERVRRPASTLTMETSGIRHLAPEVQLLYAAKRLASRDREDFEHTLPRLEAPRRAWLRSALAIAHPGHEWARRLAT